MRARCGPSKALTATARKLAVIFYHMVKDGKDYHELGEDFFLTHQKARHLNKLKKQARLLGFDLTPAGPKPSHTTEKTAGRDPDT